MLFCCLRHNVDSSCHTFRRRLPPSTNSAAYQRLVASTRHGPSQLKILDLPLQLDLPFTAHLGVIGSESRFLPTLPAFYAPVRNIAMTFGIEKLECCGYLTVKKIEDMFIPFTECMKVTDGQTDRCQQSATVVTPQVLSTVDNRVRLSRSVVNSCPSCRQHLWYDAKSNRRRASFLSQLRYTCVHLTKPWLAILSRNKPYLLGRIYVFKNFY